MAGQPLEKIDTYSSSVWSGLLRGTDPRVDYRQAWASTDEEDERRLQTRVSLFLELLPEMQAACDDNRAQGTDEWLRAEGEGSAKGVWNL